MSKSFRKRVDPIAIMNEGKVWKYVSIGLMGILAIGILQPQAFALTDSQLKKKFDEIWAAINGLTTKTNSLQSQINNIELTPGKDGLNCWDTNGDGVKDASEDNNNDDQWDALDCQGSSADFLPNTRPIVDAGIDQTEVGIIQTGGCAFGICSNFNLLACQYDLAGNVKDDEFTGYLVHKWGPSTPASLFEDDDSLTTQLSIAFFSPSPITSDLSIPVTLTADDGILEGSDEVIMTCELPQ